MKLKHLPFPKGNISRVEGGGKERLGEIEIDHGKYQIEFPLALLLN